MAEGPLQVAVSAVAERLVAAVLAAAQGNGGLGGNGQFDRAEFTALVGAVAEGLVGRFAAGAPPIDAWFQLQDVGGFFRYLRFGHIGSSMFARKRRVCLPGFKSYQPGLSRRAPARSIGYAGDGNGGEEF